MIPERNQKFGSIKKNPHQIYDKAKIAHVLDALSTKILPRGTISRIHEETWIPKSTLSDWHRIRTQPGNENWFPNCDGHPNRRMFNQETERQISEEIAQQAGTGLGPTTLALRLMLLDKYAECPNPKYERFCASTTFVSDFMKRNKLSYRKPHGEKRTIISSDHVNTFKHNLEKAYQDYPKERIFNMDETCWKISPTPLKVISKTGVPTVKINASQNQKLSLTAIATVDANGKKLPLWLLVKGKTIRCEKKLGQPNENLIFGHTPNGWANEKILISYLEWIHEKCQKEKCLLIWDVYAAHRSQVIKDKAKELNIELLYVPAGGTSIYQPLDVRIFGELKSRARQKFEHLAFMKKNREITYDESIKILLESWESIPEENIEKSWEIINQ